MSTFSLEMLYCKEYSRIRNPSPLFCSFRGLTKPAPVLDAGEFMFLSWIPAGVYPDGNRVGNDNFGV